ncbi:MAG: hypothetical protein ABW019_08495 [Chitinophagaceae bacterium]
MKYHENDVYFYLSEGYSLISGTYTIESFFITKGQDPDNNIGKNPSAHCGPIGRMRFIIGRSGSGKKGAGGWFNDQVPASQSIKNDTAGDLNFAFLGTLELNITGGLLGAATGKVVFQKIALAQGKSGFDNLWWFGGQHCSYLGGDKNYLQVIARGSFKGGDAFFIFRRKANEVNEILVTPVVFLNTVDWMRRLPGSTELNQIMMPGSHDAGMSELNHCAPFAGADRFTQTQSGSIGQQLVNGSRYFDIRVDYDYNTLVTYHRNKDGWGCNGQDLKAVLDQTGVFLQAHPTETAIFRFAHIRGDSGHDQKITKQKIAELLDSPAYSTVIYKFPFSPINLATASLDKIGLQEGVRGKMILTFNYNEYIDPRAGRFRYMKGDAAKTDANLTVSDHYSDTTDYSVMARQQVENWGKYGGLGQGYLFLLSWTLTPHSLTDPGVDDLAKTANSNLASVLYLYIDQLKFSNPNIVNVDYLNADVAQSIIQYNF